MQLQSHNNIGRNLFEISRLKVLEADKPECYAERVMSPPQQPTPMDFAAQAEQGLTRLRNAIAQVVAAIPNFAYRRPSELADRLSLDPKLAWNLARCLEMTDPFSSARFLPGPTGMRTFLRAARRCEVSGELLQNARDAFDAFDQLVTLHAGTRKCFNAMAAGLSKAGRERCDVEIHRLTFEGNRYVWGVQARTVFRANIIHPSESRMMWDLVTLRGTIDLRRMRPHVAWRFSRISSVDSSHTIRTSMRRASLDPRSATGLPLLLDFCTQPVPQFLPVLGPTGEEEFEFVASSVGNTACLTCVTGEIVWSVEPTYRTPLYTQFSTIMRLRTPAESVVFDLLIHRDLFADAEPLRAELYSDLFGGGPSLRYQPSDLLPLHERLADLGEGLDGAACSEIPNYVKMLEYAFRAMGRNPQEYRLYRLHLQFPPIPTTLALSRNLPEAPKQA